MPPENTSSLKKIQSSLQNFLTPTHHRALVFSIRFILITVVGLSIIFFMTGTIQKQMIKNQKTKSQIATQQQRISSLNELKQTYESVKNDLPKLYGLLVPADSIGEFINQLDALSDTYALQASLKIGDRIEDINGSYIPLTITTNSNIDTLKRYILALEELPFLVYVNEFEFNGKINENGPVIIHAKIFTN